MDEHSRPIRFFHQGRVVEVADAAPTRSVLDWLREDAHCTGTKEGCAEGDCGACTVVLGEANNGALKLRSVNACIQFMPTLDGKALFAVEDVAPPGGALHPVQRAMVDCHGSQCGFCTPGFIMSMWAVYQRHAGAGTRPTRQELADGLSGNLCRCTGYRPILDAGERMFDGPLAQLDERPVLDALASIVPRDGGFEYAVPGRRFHAPRSIDALAALCESRPQARLLAGATDIGLWVNKQLRDLPELIYVGAIDEMKRILERSDAALVIGAGASLEDAWAALAERHPALREMWLRFASPPIRNAGTMGGNIANGSPIGDSAPVLMALDANVVLRKGPRVRSMPLADFYVDYMRNRLEPGEFVLSIEVPPAARESQLRAYKISKRYDSDISALACGFSIRLDGAGAGAVRDVRLAFGGMAAIVKRADHAEAAIRGQPWNPATVTAAQAALERDFTPLTDLRASREYRVQVGRNLLQRFWLETRADQPLAVRETSVWAAA